MERKIEIEKRLAEIRENIGDYTKDFLLDYNLAAIRDLDSAITEFADSQVNIYYSDIWAYYEEHKVESSNALREYGYNFDDFNSLDEIIEKASQLAQFNEIENEIISDYEALEEYQELLVELDEIEKGV